MELNLFDLGVVLIIGLSALLAFFRGFVREMLSLGGWAVASIVTLRFVEPATAFIKPQIKSEVVASGIAAVGLFFITLVAISIAASFIVKVLKPGDKVGLFDNLAGLAFGTARGALIVAIAFFAMTVAVTPKDYPQAVKDAYATPYVEQWAKWVAQLTPKTLDRLTKDRDDSALGKRTKDTLEEMGKRSSDAVDSLDQKIQEEAESLPSMRDLQQRMREENERH